jgi:hypothetical protein
VKIADFDSVSDLTTPQEIEAALRKRHGAGFNSFWLSHGADKSPAINIMVNGDLAYIHYFPEDHHPGFMSVGGLSELRLGGTTDFFLSLSEKEPLDLLNEGGSAIFERVEGCSGVCDFQHNAKMHRLEQSSAQ